MREAAGHALAAASGLIFPFVQTLILSRVFENRADFGLLASITVSSAFVTTAVGLGVEKASFLRMAGAVSEPETARHHAVQRKTLLGRILAGLVVWTLWWALTYPPSPLTWALGAVPIALALPMQALTDVAAALRRPLAGAVVASTLRGVQLLALIVMIRVLERVTLGTVFAISTVSATATLWFMHRYIASLLPGLDTIKIPRAEAAQLIRDALPYAWLGFLSAIYIQADVLVLSHYHDFEEVGRYRVALLLSTFSVAGYAPVAMYWQPRLARANTDGPAALHAAINRFTTITFLAVLAGMIATIVIAPFLFNGYLDRFADALPLLGPMLAGWLLYYMPPYGEGLHVLRLPHLVTRGALGFASLNLALNIVFVPRFGAQGAAWTTAATFAVLRIYILIVTSRIPALRLGYRNGIVTLVGTAVIAVMLAMLAR